MDEYIEIDMLIKNVNIYGRAIAALGKEQKHFMR